MVISCCKNMFIVFDHNEMTLVVWGCFSSSSLYIVSTLKRLFTLCLSCPFSYTMHNCIVQDWNQAKGKLPPPKRLTKKDPLLENEEEYPLQSLVVHPVASSLLEKDFNWNPPFSIWILRKCLQCPLSHKKYKAVMYFKRLSRMWLEVRRKFLNTKHN